MNIILRAVKSRSLPQVRWSAGWWWCQFKLFFVFYLSGGVITYVVESGAVYSGPGLLVCVSVGIRVILLLQHTHSTSRVHHHQPIAASIRTTSPHVRPSRFVPPPLAQPKLALILATIKSLFCRIQIQTLFPTSILFSLLLNLNSIS